MCACGNASLCDLAAVMKASKEDDAVLVHQHAVPAAGRGPALAGQLLPGPVFQIQPPQVLVVLELLLYWHLIFLQPVRHMSGYQRPNGLSSTPHLCMPYSARLGTSPALLLACRRCSEVT